MKFVSQFVYSIVPDAYFMRPKVRRAFIVADPIRIHEVNQAALSGALESCDNLRAGVRTAAIAVLIELIVAFVGPGQEGTKCPLQSGSARMQSPETMNSP